jgi:hypothetical protein
MKFQQRLNRYLIGIVIGIMLVVVFFRDRDWGKWTPENMVLQQLKNYQTDLDSTVQCRISCLGLAPPDFDKLYKDGDVRISESQPRADPRVYKIYSTTRDEREFYVIANIHLEPDWAKIIEVGMVENEPTCDCN